MVQLAVLPVLCLQTIEMWKSNIVLSALSMSCLWSRRWCIHMSIHFALHVGGLNTKHNMHKSQIFIDCTWLLITQLYKQYIVSTTMYSQNTFHLVATSLMHFDVSEVQRMLFYAMQLSLLLLPRVRNKTVTCDYLINVGHPLNHNYNWSLIEHR